jgi:2-oxoglutarate ferredoxin oxidoreductase subunit beta
MHDGSLIHLQKLAEGWNPQDRYSALNAVHQSRERGEILTGLIFMDAESQELHETIQTANKPLNSLKEKDLCPGNQALQNINESFR